MSYFRQKLRQIFWLNYAMQVPAAPDEKKKNGLLERTLPGEKSGKVERCLPQANLLE